MEVLVLNGKNYVKASKAARDLGYASDYVSQLCRNKQVDAHLIGRAWYVDEEQLSTHRSEKKRMSRSKAREHAKKSIEEHRISVKQTQDNYKNIAIHYEQDGADLIPKTRKLAVETEKQKNHIYRSRGDISEEAIIQNTGDKMILSGDVDITDVTDETSAPDTIFSVPQKATKFHPRVQNISHDKTIKTPVHPVPIRKKVGLRERPEEIIRDTKEALLVNNTITETGTTVQKAVLAHKKSNVAPYYMIIVLICFMVFGTVSLSYSIVYVQGNALQTMQGTTFSIHKSISIITDKYEYLGKTR